MKHTRARIVKQRTTTLSPSTMKTGDITGPYGSPCESLAALAKYYLTPPESAFHREDLIEHARIALGKYDLTPEELDEAAPLLARALHMRIEQNGGRDLDDEHKQVIEHQVLEWCGCYGAIGQARAEAKATDEAAKTERIAQSWS